TDPRSGAPWDSGCNIRRIAKAYPRRSRRAHLRLFPGREVGAIRMVEHHGADAGLGLHHHAFGELDADLLRPQQRPQSSLVVEVRTGRVSEAVALAAIT